MWPHYTSIYSASCYTATNIGYASCTSKARPVCSRQVIPEQPYRKKGPGNHRHECKHAFHQHISKYTNIHTNRRYTGGNLTGCRPPNAKIVHNTGLATQKVMKWNVECSVIGQFSISWEWSMASSWKANKWIIIPFLLQTQILKQLYSNDTHNEKTRILTRKLVYWVNMDRDLKKHKVVCHMPGISEDTTTREDNPILSTKQVVDGGWH